MEEEDEDQKQFFKDLGATAEQTVEEVRGFEENYYSLTQRALTALPWVADYNKKLHGYVEQDFAARFRICARVEPRTCKISFGFIPSIFRNACGRFLHRRGIFQKRTSTSRQVRYERPLSIHLNSGFGARRCVESKPCQYVANESRIPSAPSRSWNSSIIRAVSAKTRRRTRPKHQSRLAQ
jgi:hypothetical protein